jgi:hypothetical protein
LNPFIYTVRAEPCVALSPWPAPPANATIASADTSRVLPQHRNIVAVIGEKFGALAAGAAGMRKKELEGISTKLGGMLVFLNEGEGEEHVSAPVAEQLSRWGPDAHVVFDPITKWEAVTSITSKITSKSRSCPSRGVGANTVF